MEVNGFSNESQSLSEELDEHEASSQQLINNYFSRQTPIRLPQYYMQQEFEILAFEREEVDGGSNEFQMNSQGLEALAQELLNNSLYQQLPTRPPPPQYYMQQEFQIQSQELEALRQEVVNNFLHQQLPTGPPTPQYYLQHEFQEFETLEQQIIINMFLLQLSPSLPQMD